MPLRETATIVKPKGSGFECGIARLRKKLDADDQAWLNDQLAGEASHQWISDVLLKDPQAHKVSAAVIGAHRAGRCRCGSL